MNYKVKGTITAIGEKKTVKDGAVVLNYVVNDNQMYPTEYNFDMYKKAEDAKFIDQFLEFNKVGDEVEVEFTIRSREYQGRIYNSLSHWRCDKATTEASRGGSDAPNTEQEEDLLPF